jgi:hypothetical protein
LTFQMKTNALVYSREYGYRHWPLDRVWNGWLTGAHGRKLGLAGLEPRRAEILGEHILMEGRGGIVILRGSHGDGPTSQMSRAKEPADLFEPKSVDMVPARGLALDGDLSEWPENGWQEMRPDRHMWPLFSERDTSGGSLAARFAWAIDERFIWLAVRVDDHELNDDCRALTVGGDRVEVMLISADPQLRHRSKKPGLESPVVIELTWLNRVPIALVRSPSIQYAIGRTVADGALFTRWAERNLAADLALVEEVVIAATRDDHHTYYELRIKRTLLDDGVMAGFDLRVTDEDGGETIGDQLEWCGALSDPGTFEVAPFHSIH